MEILNKQNGDRFIYQFVTIFVLKNCLIWLFFNKGITIDKLNGSVSTLDT